MRKALPVNWILLNINGSFLMQRTVVPFIRQLGGCMTQELSAEKLNASRQTISKWEADAANLEMGKALSFARYSTVLPTTFFEKTWMNIR